MYTKFIDMTGQRFANVTVLKRSGHDKNKAILWECRCDCGATFCETRSNLLSGRVTSCGCNRKKRASTMNKTHGESRTRLHRIWLNMKNRCNNPRTERYEGYGGRGIKVCEEWNNSYEVFKEWAIKNGYKDGLSIDRIDNDGNY